MILKLNLFIGNLDKAINTQASSIEIIESTGLMPAFDIIINDETHTLGFLLQSYINKKYIKDNIFVGYMNPHPLEKKIKLRIKIEDNDITKLVSICKDSCSDLIKMFSDLISSCSSFKIS